MERCLERETAKMPKKPINIERSSGTAKWNAQGYGWGALAPSIPRSVPFPFLGVPTMERRVVKTLAGRSQQWIKVKNPKAPAATREAQEEWSK